TIHPVRTTGLVVGVPQTFFYFEKMQDRIIEFIASHSKVSKEKLHELMMATDQMATDVGSVVDGNEAVSIGLIDEIGGLSDALGALREMRKNHKNK
ncbi:MAG: ATP-dependent Clp protease proteolytic subunit, partial [Clostridia bacterium]|nr:ATP-dependent Clp protease proteolytic subunit [Clostridia bacterium]